MTIRKLPVPDVVELHGAEAWRALRDHFGWPDEATQPMPLDELPAGFELQPLDDERARWARVLCDLWENTHAR